MYENYRPLEIGAVKDALPSLSFREVITMSFKALGHERHRCTIRKQGPGQTNVLGPFEYQGKRSICCIKKDAKLLLAIDSLNRMHLATIEDFESVESALKAADIPYSVDDTPLREDIHRLLG